MKAKKLISFVLVVALVLALGLTGCGKVEYEEVDVNDAVEAGEYDILWNVIGSKVTLDNVTEKDGLAYATVDGTEYELGMDFLSMAMVYRAETEEEYNEWWRLYIQRWNYLLPEVPLYSNQYYDVYNAKLTQVKENPTNPYWGVQNALIDWKSADGRLVMGSVTDLVGKFRYPSFGVTNPSASDSDIAKMTQGYATVETTVEGSYVWNDTIVAEHSETNNADGSKTYTMKIKEGLKLSDGDAITAKNYLAAILALSTPISVEAGATGKAGLQFVGFDEFNAYTGVAADGANKVFTGVRMLDDYTFSITIDSEYLPYYYSIATASIAPYDVELWLGADSDIADDGEGCYITGKFYDKAQKDGKDSYVFADTMNKNVEDIATFGWSGPYTVTKYDSSTKEATLTLNPNFIGDYRGHTPSIQTIVYIKIVSETQTDKFKQGEIDVLSGITGKADTDAALALVNSDTSKYGYIYYNRAGYGKLGFRADFGPAQFTEVRQAIGYSIDAYKFMEAFCGQYGTVVFGPYYEGSAYYMANKAALEENLNSYAYSIDSAKQALIDGGFIYNVEGKNFNEKNDTIRYKKLEGIELTAYNILYHSQDNAYKTVKINGEYYMPCVINWFCTVDNEVSELLKLYWQNDSNETAKKIGMNIQFTQGEWSPMLGELYQYDGYGWNGDAVYSAFNFATGFTSAIYDYSYNWTIDPAMYDDYSICYLKDEADFVWKN